MMSSVLNNQDAMQAYLQAAQRGRASIVNQPQAPRVVADTFARGPVPTRVPVPTRSAAAAAPPAPVSEANGHPAHEIMLLKDSVAPSPLLQGRGVTRAQLEPVMDACRTIVKEHEKYSELKVWTVMLTCCLAYPLVGNSYEQKKSKVDAYLNASVNPQLAAKGVRLYYLYVSGTHGDAIGAVAV